MALTEPFDILADWPGWTPEFELQWRQEVSRTAGGQAVVKDLGSPLWRMSAVTKALRANTLDYWKARLDALENGMKTFKGYPLSRCFPILYPNGSWPTGNSFNGVSAALHTVESDRKTIKVSALPATFQLRVGDMIGIGERDLHRVMENATADGSGVTGLFEVRPHIWPGIEDDDSPMVAVSVKRPFCLMMILPGSVSASADPTTGRGSVAFQAMEAR